MRAAALARIAPLLFCLGFAAPGWAQAPALSASQSGIGKLEVHIDRFEHALGVVTTLQREDAQSKLPSPPNAECRGICYFPNRVEPVAWQCAPRQRCELHCTVIPPVGGCR